MQFDPSRQCYPGQPLPEPDVSEDFDPSRDSEPRTEPWLMRAPSWHGRDAAASKAYLDGLSDADIIDEYNRLRDTRVAWDNGYYYPNIKHLFLTPLEQEKDRREIALWRQRYGDSEVAEWYLTAKEKPCTWWLQNHIIARHALKTCMNCGACTAGCTAAQFHDIDPRLIVEVALSGDEERIIALLKSDTLWYCGQCGHCKLRCPRGNNPFALISSLRQLSQLKGYHVESERGCQQYTGRHLWGGNLWNRACSLYFRNIVVKFHQDFGPKLARYADKVEQIHRRIGGCPDMDGDRPGRKVHPDTLHEFRRCLQEGGSFVLWDQIEAAGRQQADTEGIDLYDYFYRV